MGLLIALTAVLWEGRDKVRGDDVEAELVGRVSQRDHELGAKAVHIRLLVWVEDDLEHLMLRRRTQAASEAMGSCEVGTREGVHLLVPSMPAEMRFRACFHSPPSATTSPLTTPLSRHPEGAILLQRTRTLAKNHVQSALSF